MNGAVTGGLLALLGVLLGSVSGAFIERRKHGYALELSHLNEVRHQDESSRQLRLDTYLLFFGAVRSFRNAVRNRTHLIDPTNDAGRSAYLDHVANAFQDLSASISAVALVTDDTRVHEHVSELVSITLEILRAVGDGTWSNLDPGSLSILERHFRALEAAEQVARRDIWDNGSRLRFETLVRHQKDRS